MPNSCPANNGLLMSYLEAKKMGYELPADKTLQKAMSDNPQKFISGKPYLTCELFYCKNEFSSGYDATTVRVRQMSPDGESHGYEISLCGIASVISWHMS